MRMRGIDRSTYHLLVSQGREIHWLWCIRGSEYTVAVYISSSSVQTPLPGENSARKEPIRLGQIVLYSQANVHADSFRG